MKVADKKSKYRHKSKGQYVVIYILYLSSYSNQQSLLKQKKQWNVHF